MRCLQAVCGSPLLSGGPSQTELVVVVVVVVGAVVVVFLADHVEVLVQLDLDLAAVRQKDLDAVRGSVVAGLGLGDRAAAGVLEGGRNGPVVS